MTAAARDTVPYPGLPRPGGSTYAGEAGLALPQVGGDVAGQPADVLNTVGLALLAYGLVQLLSKVVDRLPLWRAGGGHDTAAVAGFVADDRKRLDRLVELVVADHERIQRIGEEIREIHEHTRWLGEQRHRVDARDGEPIMQCKGRAVVDQLAVNQRLIGQALDELRTVQTKLDDTLRKLRALWVRVGRRRNDSH
ncbi:MAG TPA: hypothetical protein VF263_01955 [Longimicrobiaceae bacterium]